MHVCMYKCFVTSAEHILQNQIHTVLFLACSTEYIMLFYCVVNTQIVSNLLSHRHCLYLALCRCVSYIYDKFLETELLVICMCNFERYCQLALPKVSTNLHLHQFWIS